jgi:hypothetical protein
VACRRTARAGAAVTGDIPDRITGDSFPRELNAFDAAERPG